ncbi:MAG: NUDIX hydrolase [Candidatus Omnitrophica bacterium]|nr:NUDIX hydrolase [Candidatus Omnitrophota bacterium]
MLNNKNPLPTVDIIIEYDGGVVLIERMNPPYGWAIPGGFVDYNESLEAAALREAKEETNLTVSNLKQFHAYSAPERDPRGHTIANVFTGQGKGELSAASDAQNAAVFFFENLPKTIAFDHRKILDDYFCLKNGKEPQW